MRLKGAGPERSGRRVAAEEDAWGHIHPLEASSAREDIGPRPSNERHSRVSGL